MELVPWKPFGELSSFRREMDQLWERFFGDESFRRTFSDGWLPAVDFSETKDTMFVKAELPGMEAKDVNVSISGDVLMIKGEKKKEEEHTDEHYYSCERYSGTFHRSFQLPANVKTNKVEATFDRGVLKIMLPKTEIAKEKRIEVKVK